MTRRWRVSTAMSTTNLEHNTHKKESSASGQASCYPSKVRAIEWWRTINLRAWSSRSSDMTGSHLHEDMHDERCRGAILSIDSTWVHGQLCKAYKPSIDLTIFGKLEGSVMEAMQHTGFMISSRVHACTSALHTESSSLHIDASVPKTVLTLAGFESIISAS